MVDGLATAIAEGEAKARDGKDDDLPDVDELLAEAENWPGVCDESNLDVFAAWWALGGPDNGLSPVEVAKMPSAMRKDFSTILVEVSRQRRAHRREKPNGRHAEA